MQMRDGTMVPLSDSLVGRTEIEQLAQRNLASDMNDDPIKVGDIVVVPARVRAIDDRGGDSKRLTLALSGGEDSIFVDATQVQHVPDAGLEAEAVAQFEKVAN